MTHTKNKWIGDRAFYSNVIRIALPIVIQNGISTFVNLLDNLMVGRLGTEAMSGVSIVNQFMFVFNLMIFGAVSAAGIFMAQYNGKGDVENERYTFRFKFLICAAAGVIGTGVFALLRDPLIMLFLRGGDAAGDLSLTLDFGRQYLNVMLIGLLPFAVANVYASSYRETNDTMTPMLASIAAVATNFVLNYILIFGSFGAPRLGVQGAAIATVISRFVELAILMLRMHIRTERFPFIVGAYRSMYIPGRLTREITVRGLPLMANEFFWSLAVTLTNQCYSTRGLEVVAALNIYSTLQNVFNVVNIAMGSSIAIIVGNLLGAGRIEEAKDTDRKMIVFSIFCALFTGGLLICCSGVFPLLYNTEDSVRALAEYMLIATGILMPFGAFTNATYFTLRSGGQVLITMLMDSVYMWVLVIPVCFILSRLTGIDIHGLFAVGQSMEILKCALGFVLLKRGNWARQLVADGEKTDA